MTATTTSGDAPGDAVTALLRMMWRRKMIVAGVMTLIPLTAALISLTLPVRYHAAAKVLLVVPRADRAGGGTAPSARTVRARLASQIQMLTSRGVLRRVVKRRDLVQAPAFNPALRPDRTLFARLGLTAAGREPPPHAVQRRRATATLRRRLTVRREGRSRVARIGITAPDPAQAARLANAVASVYIDRRKARRERVQKRSTRKLAAKVEAQRADVKEAEDALAAYRRKTGLSAKPGSGAAAQELSRLTSDLARARADLAEARARVARVEKLLETNSLDSAAAVMDSRLMTKLRLRMVELRAKKAELATEYGPKHPRMRTVKAQLKNLSARIDRQARRVARTQRNEAAVAERRVAALEEAVAQQRARLAERRQQAVKLRRLKRKAATERELLTTFLTRLRKADSAGPRTRPLPRPLARAQPPLNPSAPNRTLIVALAVLAAMPCAGGLALLADRRDTAIANLDQLERATGTPNAVQVPKVDGRGAVADALVGPGPSAFREAVYQLRDALAYTGTPARMLVTSARPREGKSTLALGLGRALARSGATVVLVEADLHHPTLAPHLRLPESPGLTDLLAGTAEGAIRQDPASGLAVVPAGHAEDPGDVLTGGRLGRVLDRLAAAYDHVIVDTPPVLPVSDAQRVARHVAAVIVAVRWRTTRPGTLARALNTLAPDGAKPAAAVLTRVDRRRQKHFGAGEEVANDREARDYYPGASKRRRAGRGGGAAAGGAGGTDRGGGANPPAGPGGAA